MPLTKQLIPISFASGLDTKTDEKQVIPGKLLELQNGEFTNTGAINKRPGSTLLSTAIVGGSNIAGAETIAAFRNEQLVFDGYNMYSYLPSTSQWISRGVAVSATVDDLTVIRQTTTQQLSPDMATLNGVALWAWEDSRGGIYYCTRDTSSNSFFVPNAQLDSDGYKPKCLAFDGYLCVIFYDIASTCLRLATINTSTPTLITSNVSLVTDVVDGYRAYDATVADGYIFVTYVNTANQLATFSINSAFAVSPSYKIAAGIGSTSIVPVSLTADTSNKLWLVWWDNTHLRGAIINSALSATVIGATTIDTPAAGLRTIGVVQDPILSNTARIFYESGGADWWQSYIKVNTFTSAGSVGVATTQVRSVGIAAKPFLYDGYIYLPASLDTSPSGLQDTYFLLQTATNTVVSKISAGLGGGHNTNQLLPETQNLAPNQYTFANLIKGGIEAEAGVLFSLLGVNATTITFNPPNSFMSAVQGNNLLINGGVLLGYDGNSLAEFGFNYYPENLNSQDFGPPTDGYNQVIVTTTVLGTVSAENKTTVLLLQANMLVPGCYVTWQTAGGINYCFWFRIAGVGVAPVFLAATTVIQVTLVGTETANQVASAVDAALSGTGYTHSVSGPTETITNSANGACTASQFVVGPNGIGAGNFQYLATYEWSDVFGQIQRSATSPPFSITTDGYCCSVNIDVPTYRLSSKAIASDFSLTVRIVIYRTQNNGTLFYRVTSAISPLLNNPLVDDLTFIDTLPDSALINNELVYTTGSVLDNFAPPSNKFITTYRNRVWLGGIADNPYTVWFSKVINDLTANTTLPVEFSDALTFSVEDLRAGKITALSVLDSSLIIFLERGIYSLTGDGPDATGANSDYGDPTMVAAGDVGCTYPNGLQVTPNGIIFKSNKGGDIFLLDRSGQMQYCGTPVTAFSNLDISAAQLNPIADQVLFTTLTGSTLVYDYFASQWSTWTTANGIVDMDVWNGSLVYATSNGNLFQQTPAAFTDNSAAISMKLTTGWLSFAGLQGFKRVYDLMILGTYKTPHTLTVQIAYDYIDTYTQTVVIDTATLTNPSDYQFRIFLDQQRCQAIKISIYDTPEAPYGEGFSISSLAFTVGVKKGHARISQGQQFGS